jgi:UDP-2,4-diacetamido-2,4,6-trideoxy-beta-L-altropyranose hydrolase
MNVAFRVDSSLKMGIGHLMRCINLANLLKKNNHKIIFICEDLDGNLNYQIKFKVYTLPKKLEKKITKNFNIYDLNQKNDSIQTVDVIPNNIDLLIVDSYELGELWQKRLRPFTKKIMVIDDLANRKFDCDILLNQNPGFLNKDYKSLVPEKCKLLIGSKYALLRPEFAKLRNKALKKRKNTKEIKNIFISLGGSDINNVTYDVLKNLHKNFNITVVLGKKSPHNKFIKNYTDSKNIQVIENSNNMSDLMLKADIAIGAGGSTSLERCCLGLPSLVYVLAENQIRITEFLDDLGAISKVKNLNSDFKNLSQNLELWQAMSKKSQHVCDGIGTNRVLNEL